MPWIYQQSTGKMLRPDGTLLATGYSGSLGDARNNVDYEAEPDEGPIPQGSYTIEAPRNSANTGKHVMPLTPIDHDAYGRNDFQIHGDARAGSARHGNASTGCIIISPIGLRKKISTSGDNILEVVE